MTCREKLKLEHPDWSQTRIADAVIGSCPGHHGYAGDGQGGFCKPGASCEECWDREIPEETDVVTDACFAEDGVSPVIKDSGDRTQFESGAVRDMRIGKGRCDLMPLEVVSYIFSHEPGINKIFDSIAMFQKEGDTAYLNIAVCEFARAAYSAYKHPEVHMFLEVAKHYEDGAKKYGDNNWQKGIPTWCYIDSAVRHYLKWLRGDKDEPHDRAFVWNLMCCIWEVDYSPRAKET